MEAGVVEESSEDELKSGKASVPCLGHFCGQLGLSCTLRNRQRSFQNALPDGQRMRTRTLGIPQGTICAFTELMS